MPGLLSASCIRAPAHAWPHTTPKYAPPLSPLLSEFTQFINPTGVSCPPGSPCLLIHWDSHSSELPGPVWVELFLDSRHLHFSFPPLWQVSTYSVLDAESTEWERYTPTSIPANCELYRHKGGVPTGVCGMGMARKTSWIKGGPSDSS